MVLLVWLFSSLLVRAARAEFKPLSSITGLQKSFQQAMNALIQEKTRDYNVDMKQLTNDLVSCNNKINATHLDCLACMEERCKTFGSTRRKRQSDGLRTSIGDVIPERLTMAEMKIESLDQLIKDCYDKCTECYSFVTVESDIIIRAVCGAELLMRNSSLESTFRPLKKLNEINNNKDEYMLTQIETDMDFFNKTQMTAPARITVNMPPGITPRATMTLFFLDISKTFRLMAKAAFRGWGF